MAVDYLKRYNDYVAQQDGGEEDGFVVTDEGSADWCLRKIREAEEIISGAKEVFNEQLERLEEWLESETKDAQATIERMTSLLEPYMIHKVESGELGRRKSMRLPNGTLRLRASGNRWKRDNAELAKWAEKKGLVRVKTEPAWADIGKHLVPESKYAGSNAIYVDPETGETTPVPGVKLERPAGETFSVETE